MVRTDSGWGSLTCARFLVLLTQAVQGACSVPCCFVYCQSWVWARQPCVCTQQCPTRPTLSLYGTVLCMHAAQWVCAAVPVVPARSVFKWRGSVCICAMVPSCFLWSSLWEGCLGTEYSDWPCRWARAPGWGSHLLSKCRGSVNSGAHRFLWPWGVLSASEELLQLSNLLCVATLHCFVEAFHWP